jgi:signal transduction histidine kinase
MKLKEKLHDLLCLSMTFKTKVIVGMSVILIILMGVFTYVDVMHHQEFFLEQTEGMAQGICDIVMKSIEYPMLDGEMQEVQAILERLETLESLDVVYLCDCDGVIRYSGDSSDIGRMTASEITRRALRTGHMLKGLEIRRTVIPESQKILRYAVPIPNEKACFKCHGSDKKLLGALTVGYKWDPIEKAVQAHRNRDILLFVIAVIVILFFLGTWLTGAVTRPISVLTEWANEISRGNLDASFDLRKKVPCWEEEACTKESCPAYGRDDIRCWYIDGTLCQGEPSGKFPDKLDACRNCEVYRKHVGDEIAQLADAFTYMARQEKSYREQLKQVYENNLQSERLASIGKGVAHISHEIKNPLVVIGGFTRQVFRVLEPGSPSQKKLGIVIKEIERLEELLVEISDLTRLSGLQKSLGDINDIVEEVYILMEPAFKMHHIEAHKRRPTDIPLFYFDAKQIKQVLINVVKNAIEAMPHGGRLVLETKLVDHMVKIRIMDTGKGIDHDKLQAVFDSFVTTKSKGTGLGLTISLKIIRDHGGTIKIESEPGKGTTCIIALPVESGKEQRQRDA